MAELAATPGFLSLRQEIIALAELRRSDRVLDIGSGTGLLALTAAPTVSHATALDVSPEMCRHLETEIARIPLTNVNAVIGSATDLPLAAGSVDVVLSNYCFHHLNDVAFRHAAGRREHPASVDWWQRAREDCDFAEVAVRALAHEGGIATARRTS